MQSRIVLGIATALTWGLASADYLEVRRPMHIYASADRSSEVITTVSRGSQDETSILIIDPEEPIDNGYYRVRLPSGPGYGYIYRTAGRVYEDFGGPYKPYNRSAYKHWVDADRDCENTRDEVLIRDAVGKVETTHGASRCRVTGGTWTDPYSGTTLSDPSKIDVDHMVPLKNAHNSGAWAWSAQRKQDYANFLDDPVHLIAVSASENRRKGDKGPDRYLPPSTDYQCQYVQDWLDVKYAWGLNIPDSERAAVDSVLRECPAITGGGLTQ